MEERRKRRGGVAHSYIHTAAGWILHLKQGNETNVTNKSCFVILEV